MATPKIGLDLLTVGQSSKEVSVNNISYILDTLVQARVADKDLTAPPGSPSDGDSYIVAATATGDWAGQEGLIAYWHTAVGIWQFITPTSESWTVWVEDEALLYRWDGVSDWDVSASIIVAPASLNFTATADGEHALEVIADAAGYGDINALGIDYTTGAMTAADENGVVLINIDESLAAGGEVWGLGIFATSHGSAEVHALHVGIGVVPVHQHSGTVGDMDSMLVKAVDQLAALVHGGAGNISIFVADNDTITVGDAAMFSSIEITIDTAASGSGVTPTFEYSTGVGTWTSFAPTDGTSGFQNSGIIAFDSGDLAGFAVGTGSEYLIRITRTKNTVTTTPIIDEIQISGFVEFKWDELGDVTINDLVCASLRAGAVPTVATAWDTATVIEDNIFVHAVGGGYISLWRDDATISGTNGLGSINFGGSDGDDIGAKILGRASGTWNSTDAPSALEFQVCATGDDTLDIVATMAIDATASYIEWGVGGSSVEFKQILDSNSRTHYISGGNASNAGANLTLWGGAHSSLANDFRFRADGTTVFDYDHSATEFTFAGDLTLSEGKVSITDTANETALTVTSSATTADTVSIAAANTTGDALDIVASSLTTGAAIRVYSNSSSASTRNLVQINNDHATATGTTLLHLLQDAGQRALFIDQNANHKSIEIDAESTTSTVFKINATSTTGNLIDLNGPALTTGAVISAYSDSADVGTRNLVLIWNDNVAAAGATALKVVQDASADAIYVDFNGTGSGSALELDSTGTTSAVLNVHNDQLSTGWLALFDSASVHTGTRNLVGIVNDSALAVNTTALSIQQDAAARAMFIDQNGDGIALDIDSESTTSTVVNINAVSTTGNILNIQGDSLTTGYLADFDSNSSSASTRSVVRIRNDAAAATGATCLTVKQDAGQNAIFVDVNANGRAIHVDSESTSATVIKIDHASTTGTGISSEGDFLTTGRLAYFYSNSVDVSARSLVMIVNDSALADAAVCLDINQDGNAYSLYIDSEATTNTAVRIDSNNTTGQALYIVASNLSAGSALNIYSDSSNASARSLISITNDNTAAVGATGLGIKQDAAAYGISLDQNGNAPALFIDAEHTTSIAALDMRVDAITTGGAIYVNSNSTSVSARTLVHIINDNTAATGTIPLAIKQDAAATAFYIDHNANGTAIDIDAENTTADAMSIQCDAITSGDVLQLGMNASNTSTRRILYLNQQHASASGATIVEMKQAADQRVLFIDHNGNGKSIDIDAENTTALTIDVQSDALTTGKVARFYSNSADVSTRVLVEIRNDNAAAVGATCLSLNQDANAGSLAMTNSGATDATALEIWANNLTTGRCARFYSNSSSTGSRNLVLIHNDHASATGTVGLTITQDSTGLAMQINGNAAISGSLSKGSGSFLINHPLKEMNKSHKLRHSFVESPKAENLYSGMVKLVGGVAEVNIDEHSGMTEGTFLALNTPTSWNSSNEGGFTPVRCSLSGNILTIESLEDCGDQIYWEVRGERRDQHMIDTNWTDDEGRVIVEHLNEDAK